ncbi:Mediator of RNA polymerase II transcription subunit 16 [Zootermopsis nevadensis]|uniref:Mediator of RNA polymerase II transcription subunit 16 n=2 Tax=Zootermopsis nevadensis TaxID=136037 RepID=A0A067R9H3_ZOONE|nr:Mediator of RNA polymerase II transcription subunit 16 [Zootermopsis nevadensis]
MDLIYAVFRKHTTSSTKSLQNFECLHEGHTLCSVSSQNIVAFTTTTEIEDISGKTWGSHVYVADLNTPWYSHKVVSNKTGVTALEWDLPGDKLLVADTAGNVQLWSFKDHILNDWVCLGTASFPGEHILGAAFFHNGKKISLVSEKKDNVYYNEKFTHLRFPPSVRYFGGRPMEGCLVISTTGMVGVVIASREGHQGSPQLIITSDSLGSTRHRITAVDICYGKNGHFLVAVSSGSVSLPIQCFRVSVKQGDEKCVIMSQALPSFFLQSSPIKENQYRHVSQLKFVVREDADSLVVAANGDSGCLIEIWELREKPLPIHKLFQPKSHSSQTEPFKTVLWQHQSHFMSSSPVVCITTSKLSITTTMPPPCYVMVALADGSIHCLYRDSLKQVATASLNQAWRQEEAPSSKQQRLGLRISHLDMSWLGCVLVATDTQGQLYLYRLLPISEPGGPMTVPYACTLLEYCLVTGLDWWDLLVSLRPSMMDTVCERFTESFNRQLQQVQQFHYVQFLNIKTSLYRLTVNGQSKAADLTSLLMLHSVATAFKSLLRPSDLSSHDKGPAESLATVMMDSLTDVDKVLFHLEAKEFTVEPSTLQSLQQLIQWVADLALNLLARLPEQRQPGKSSGYELLRDYKALNTLRELLVIIRIWGLLRQSCLPVFVRSAENLDVLALLFRLISRLIQTLEADENLLDECCLLPSQVMIPQLNPPTKIVAVASPALFYQSLPIQLEFGVEPECLHFVPELSPVEGSMQTEQTVDSIRHIYLGKQPLVVKQCCRCGCKAQVQSMTRTAAIRAWDQRWARACRCGGHWRIHRFL